VDWQLNTNNTLSVRYSYLDLDRNVWGVGLYNLPGSGYSYVQLQQLGQVTETAVLSNSVVNETRFQFNHNATGETAQSEAPPGDRAASVRNRRRGFGPHRPNGQQLRVSKLYDRDSR
jgi:hypothetical protein